MMPERRVALGRQDRLVDEVAGRENLIPVFSNPADLSALMKSTPPPVALMKRNITSGLASLTRWM